MEEYNTNQENKTNLYNKLKTGFDKFGKKAVSGLAAVVLSAGLVTGCAEPLKEGEIYNKTYEPERNYVMIMPLMISNGKSFTTLLIPMFIHDDEDYIIRIRNHEDGKLRTQDYYVSKETYEAAKTGDWFLYTKDNAQLEDIVEKHRASNQEKEKYGITKEN